MKKTPLRHQDDEFKLHGMEESRGVHWEQGVGKTYLALWEAEALYQAGKIDAVIVLAPNGIHTNWINYEIPETLETKHLALAYQSGKISTKKHQREVQGVFDYRDGIAILTMSYDAVKTPIGKRVVRRFLNERKCFFLLDESNRIKTPGAKVTRTVVALGRYATYKRTLCGTPIANKPFDIYTQFRFLDPDFWRNTPYGLADYQDFKSFFGIWETGYLKGKDGKADREFPQCVGYRNLHVLNELVRQKSSRVLKEDVLKDLPPKTYAYKGFDMTPKQRKLYTQIEEEFMAELDNGEILFTPLAITRMLRLQQVSCGYLPSEIITEANAERVECVLIDKKNPRLDMFGEICEDLPHKALVWCRFIKDIDLICEKLGDVAVRWDGTMSLDEREDNKRRFKTEPMDKVQFLVATAASMGEGHTLNEALTAIYYSSTHNLRERLQSEDRFHRHGQIHQVTILDLIANRSQDKPIIQSLRKKFDSASQVIDGKHRDWLLTYVER